MPGAETLFALEHLGVRFGSAEPAVRDFTLEIAQGECLGIVGESGAGKSLALLAAMGLAPAAAKISGVARFRNANLIDAPPQLLAEIRGRHVAMIFQDPMSSLTPHLRVGTQLTESLRAHGKATWRTARMRAQSLLVQVRIAEPARRLDQYPHELSGGMQQRVMIAMALASEPELIIADEPTTSLDVTTQAGILALLLEFKRERGLALALISHDFGVIAGIADRVAVVRGGRILETGDVSQVLSSPRDGYTKMLIADAHALEHPAVQRRGHLGERPRIAALPMLYADSISVGFPRARQRALDRVAVNVGAGESFGVLGESGSGKSTLIRALAQLIPLQEGRVAWIGSELGTRDRALLRRFRAGAQLIFQNPFGSLDPSMTVAQIVAEPLRIHRPVPQVTERELVASALADVQLDSTLLSRFPEQLSGGQCQRVGIARALILEPKLLICDEPMSALDVSVQIHMVALFREIRRRRELAIVLVSHHLGIVRALCERALVLYRGRMMECAPVDELHDRPAHPYTRALLEAIPLADPDRQPARLLAIPVAEGAQEAAIGDGCSFRNRCPYAIDRCQSETPAWESVGYAHDVACHRWREIRETPMDLRFAKGSHGSPCMDSDDTLFSGHDTR